MNDTHNDKGRAASRPPVRLAYLVSRYPAVSHTFILREVLRLRELGFEIAVASINPPDQPPEKLTAAERAEMERTYYVKRHGLPGAVTAKLATLATRPGGFFRGLKFALRLGGTDLKKLAYGLFYFAEALMIGRWMAREKLTHLHVHFATPAATVALIASRIYPIAFSMTVHGPDEFYDAPGYYLAEKIAGASFICCIGQYARSQLMKLSSPDHWNKFEISPLGVDPALFAPRPFRVDPHPFEIICVGRLTPAKGQAILLDAIARLRADGRDPRLRFVGDGPDRATLERIVTERGLGGVVVFEGAVNQDRIRALYAAADLFALASFAEGIPVVLMEAMAMTIPCVTTFITGIPELIRDGQDGLLVAPSDAEGLAVAIARLMDDAELRQRLGKAGRARVEDKYNLRRNIDRLAAIFRRRLGGERGHG
ncbi:MAG: glycosyltransferase [Candidatus Competibacter sp.]|nr:glycosyltransferase [Candidatus Competibacter sp.]MDG4583320.1 glycosyltransferase [Candidatus Competibacter sp.]